MPAAWRWLSCADAACARHAAALLSAVAAGLFVLIASRLPLLPRFNPDTLSYLDLLPTRPPAYGLLLNAWTRLVGDLSGLPQFQAAVVVGAALALAVAATRRTGSLLLGLCLLCAIFLPSDLHYWCGLAMTDALFAASVMLMLAASLRLDPGRPVTCLLRIGVWAAMGLALRNAGMPLVAGAELLALAVAWGQRMRPWRPLAAATLPALLALALSIAVHWQVNGRATPGAWSGVSLAGKALLLTCPGDEAWLPPALHAAPSLAEEVRVAPRASDWLLRQRIRLAQYDAIRFGKLWPDLKAAGIVDPMRIDAIVGPAARRAIHRDPVGYLRLALSDWIALWALPLRITTAEREAALRDVANHPPPLLDLTEPDVQHFMAPPAERPFVVWFQRSVSVAAFAIGVVAILIAVPLLLRRRPLGQHDAMLFAALLLHGSFAVVASVEGGLSRYAMPLWPAQLLLCVLAANAVFTACRKCRKGDR